METNGWMATVQYRDQILARNHTMTPDSGGTVRYRFAISQDLDTAGIRLAIETPELWSVNVNGEGVDLAHGERWLDHQIKALPGGGLLVNRANVVELEGRPFDVRREVDQIYLLGNFSCVAHDTGFRIAPPRPLGLASWRRQVHPFYDPRSPTPSSYPGEVRGAYFAWTTQTGTARSLSSRLAEKPRPSYGSRPTGRSWKVTGMTDS